MFPDGCEWPAKVMAAYRIDPVHTGVTLEVWCRRERIRILDLRVTKYTFFLEFIIGGLQKTADMVGEPLRTWLNKHVVGMITNLDPNDLLREGQKMMGAIEKLVDLTRAAQKAQDALLSVLGSDSPTPALRERVFAANMELTAALSRASKE